MRGCLGYTKKFSSLSKADKREVRNFQRFLKLWPKYKEEMFKRPFWKKYLGLDKV